MKKLLVIAALFVTTAIHCSEKKIESLKTEKNKKYTRQNVPKLVMAFKKYVSSKKNAPKEEEKLVEKCSDFQKTIYISENDLSKMIDILNKNQKKNNRI